MSFTDTTVLATAWLSQPAMGQIPARTLLVGAATLHVRHRFQAFSFTLEAHSTAVTDNPADTLVWLADDLAGRPTRLLVWQAETILVPSLIAAAETARDGLAGAKLLRELERAFTGEVEDVAMSYGGSKAKSFDAVAHAHDLQFVAMTRVELNDAHRTSHHGAICEHLAARVKATWRLWLQRKPEDTALVTATAAWLATPEAQVRL
ncbi:hypothetical protein [Sphingomonas antarctica]|uniref:hypothetical protein n=1 Tax=Sphingomonas antarctica TaxID=2040274 RepID=UPI0039E8C87E